MPPKSRSGRKGSTASKDASASTSKEPKSAMPPPPDPLPPPRILEAEAAALSGCLKNALVKTGQICAFYSDTYKLGIQRYATHPPRSLIASLGREVERYDQLCDAIEAHLLRALAVLKRDVAREERRIQEAKTAAISTRTRSKSISSSPSSTRMPLPPVAGLPSQAQAPDTPNTQPTFDETSAPAISTSIPLGRRPSAISLSSLQRPPIPLKLDLSSLPFRIPPEETSLFTSGLASPVTLAPRSARLSTANELPADFIAAFTSSHPDLDLTVPDTADMNPAGDDVGMSIDPALGSSADKPIELDLDMEIEMAMDMDLFGDPTSSASNDANAAVEGLFSPSTPVQMPGGGIDEKTTKEGENLEMRILDVLSAVGGVGENTDVFGSLGGDSQQTHASLPPSSISLDTSPPSLATLAPSPGSLLASFQSTSHNDDPLSSSGENAVSDSSFDLDLSKFGHAFFTHTAEPEEINLMEELFNIGDVEPSTHDDDDEPKPVP